MIDFYKKQSSVQPPGLPPLDSKRAVDGERTIEQFKLLPVSSDGRNFQLQQTCTGVFDKGSGTVMESETLLVDADTGDEYAKVSSAGFFVGQSFKGLPKGEKKKSVEPPQRSPDAVHKDVISAGHALLYRLSGDYNPLHADPSVGKKMGFPGVILHGLCTYNFAAHAVLRHFGGSKPRNFVKFQARFSAPVLPGRKLSPSVCRHCAD